ncbi:HD-GYP domain-containing protein [Deinococcus sp.]|uniref:HD-GYP domain-containing protein n=1 Tax=Deinococcus sp. TaxID=47478 RepID=UPI003CC59F63
MQRSTRLKESSVPVAKIEDAALKRTRWPLLLGVGGPVVLLAVLLSVPALNPEMPWHLFHVLLVLPAAAFTVAVTVWMGYVGLRQRNAEVLLLSLAFASLGLIYAVHGLGTPEVGVLGQRMEMVEMDADAGSKAYPSVLSAGAQAGAILTALWLLLSSFPSTNALVRALLALRGWLTLLWLAALLGIGALVFMPEVTELLAPSSLPGKALYVALTTLAAAWTGARYWASWRYARFPLQLAVVYACGWLTAAQVVIVLNYAWKLSWWVYHLLLVLITVSLLVGLIRQYREGSVPLGTALRGLWNNDPDALLAAGISRPVRALVAEVEAHDPYTAGHAHRVSVYALRLARALHCPPEALRAVTQGGILHDLGKLDIPAEVLNFAGKLSEDQWALVRQHPALGFERAKRLGMLPEELGIVRWHHERWDGAGYPDRLSGEGIPLLARILAIADVFDALTSERAYRQPWSVERANDFIASEAGKAFDPALVRVWLALHAPPSPAQPAGTRGGYSGVPAAAGD